MLTERKFIDFFKKNNEYFLILGVGGVSMSSIALLLQNNGHRVLGYDMTKSAITELVESHGIPVAYDEAEIDTTNVKCAVYTSAIKVDSPLLTSLREKGIECVVRAEFLGALMKEYTNRVGIAGTHGKSTTSGMISAIFLEAGLDPTIMIGAGLAGLDGGFRLGKHNNFIFEACEYQDSFLSFSPSISVVLNVEHDHTDYFKTFEQMKESFTKFMSIGDFSVVNIDNESAKECAENADSKIFYYSSKGNKSADAYADNITFSKGKASFDAIISGERFAHISLSVLGEFQVSNAMAAISVAYLSGLEAEFVEKALSSYTGVSRRFEFRKMYNGAEIRDDYAHHPDEIKATLSAVKGVGYNHVYVVFQPHTYTRTHDLFSDFATSFENCDEVVFADIYAAREKDRFGITSKDLANVVPNGKYVGDFSEIANYIKPKLEEGDLLIIMGAGNIINIDL